MHIRMYTRIHVRMHACLLVCMYACMYERERVCTKCVHVQYGNGTHVHTYVHTCMHPSIHTYIPSYLHTYLPTYLPTYIHTHTHTCKHADIHTYRKSYQWNRHVATAAFSRTQTDAIRCVPARMEEYIHFSIRSGSGDRRCHVDFETTFHAALVFSLNVELKWRKALPHPLLG